MTAVHPELEAEQAYVDRAYGLLDRGLADAEQQFREYAPLHRATAQAMKRALKILQESRGTGQLVFGRMDDEDGPLYIGRRRVYDQDKDLVVVGWHAPAARVYYEATQQEPQGLLLKRVFVEEARRLKRVVDEITVATATAAATGTAYTISDALLAELDRSRDGAMREVVATIQAEQFRIIRADRDCVQVVQGGPGTGKTVVGLHRAAWLAFNHEDLRRQGLLVVAPNTPFLSYISGVLPSLDASDVFQADLASLYAGEARPVRVEEAATARVKGSAEMAAFLRRALTARTGWSDNDLVLSLGAVRVSIPAEQVRGLVDDVRRRTLPHSQARDVLRQSLSSLAFRLYRAAQREAGRPTIANESSIRRLSAFTNALDRMWPTFTPEELLRSIYGTQSWLLDAAEGIFTADDRARLYRPPRPNIADEPWSLEDLFCLDELAQLLEPDTVRYGHIVVDEAQDLSPMQARALARRCPSGSFTVLGDLAQATGTWVRDSWDELTVHLAGTDVRVDSLTMGYRVPAGVLDLAARQLPLISPGLVPPQSVRSGRGRPSAWRASVDDLLDRAIAVARDCVGATLTTALVVPDERYEQMVERCASVGVETGDGRDGDFAKPLTVVPAGLSKGLEFDSVVLVAPDEIVASGVMGRRTLYVAMTRCTQELHLVHSQPLPRGMEHLDPPDAPAGAASSRGAHGAGATAAPDASPSGMLTRTQTLEELIGSLGPQDRMLVELLVRRLVTGTAPSLEALGPNPND